VRPTPTRLALFLAAALVAGACSGSVFTLSVGDCFQDDAAGETEVTDVETVDCDEPHDNEVFHTFELEGEELPDEDELFAVIERECIDDNFEDYFGAPYETSEIEVFPITPTQQSWDEADDREVVCAGFVPDERVEGSLQGSGR
jgi:hypothetical protein